MALASVLERLSEALAGLLPDRDLSRDFRAREDQLPPAQPRTGYPIRYKKIDAETGDEVENADIVKGYEVDKGQYIELEPEELEAVAIESKHVIDIDEVVVLPTEIDELYMRDPYYIVPDGEVGQQAFR